MGPRKPDVVCPARERIMLATQADRIETGVRTVLRRVNSDQEGFIKLIQTAMTAQVREATIALETHHGRVIDGAEKAMCDAKLGVTRLLETITQRANSVSVHHYCFPCIKSVNWIHGKTSKTDRR